MNRVMVSTETIPDNEHEASLLLEGLLVWLDEQKIGYCVERNYEGYPARLTGDLDLLVEDDKLPSAAEGILAIAADMGWLCYQKHTWGKSAYLGLSKDLYPSRFALTVELFAGARWHGFPYLPSPDVVAQRQRSGITWGPRPAHQAIITSIHHLLYNGAVPEKYRREVHELFSKEEGFATDTLAESFGVGNAKCVVQSISREDWQALEELVTTLKKRLVLAKILKQPVATALTLIQGYLSKKRLPEGVLVHINSVGNLQLAKELLSLADRWHLFLPPVREILSIVSGESASSTIPALKRVVSTGGVLVVEGEVDDLVSHFLHLPTYRVDFTSSNFDLYSVDYKRNRRTHLLSHEVIGEEVLAARLWNAILADRADNLDKAGRVDGR